MTLILNFYYRIVLHFRHGGSGKIHDIVLLLLIIIYNNFVI
jgi:hypothetical protein